MYYVSFWWWSINTASRMINCIIHLCYDLFLQCFDMVWSTNVDMKLLSQFSFFLLIDLIFTFAIIFIACSHFYDCLYWFCIHWCNWFFKLNNADQDTFEYVASILVNISKVEAGRRILMEPKRGLLKQIIRQFDSTNQLRKKGVLAA